MTSQTTLSQKFAEWDECLHGRELQLTVAQINKVINDLTEAFYFCNRFVSQSDHGPMVAFGWELGVQNLSSADFELVGDVCARIGRQSEDCKERAYQLLGLR